MTPFELLTVAVIVALVAAAVGLLVVILKGTPRSAAGSLIGSGEFERALAAAEIGPGAERDELLAAAIAAKHLLELDTADELLKRILASDAADGEAWLERGLVAAYRGDTERALEWLTAAERHRSDLLESIALHRAWVELRAGRTERSRRLFEEISAPLESKLRSDLGPGDPLFAEWFLQAADLWREAGAADRSAWARREARRSAPESRLIARFA